MTDSRSKAVAWLILITVFICILLWRHTSDARFQSVEALPEPPSLISQPFYQASDQAFVYRVLLLWLQQFDVQSGQYVSFRQLDYQKLVGWLEYLQSIAPESQYPMLLATRIYTRVADDARKRIMLNYIFEAFERNPPKNWRWLTEATITAQHGIKDLPLALKYANALATSTEATIPRWARDMKLTILEDMGEFEQVKLLVGGLLANKQITDENELRFLNALLERLQKNYK